MKRLISAGALLALLLTDSANAGGALWTDATIPDSEMGQTRVNVLDVTHERDVTIASLEVLRHDHFDSGWQARYVLMVGSDGASRKLHISRIDAECERDAAAGKHRPEQFCDQLFVTGDETSMNFNYQSASANASMSFVLWPAPGERDVWRKPYTGMRYEPASMALALNQNAESLSAEWRVEGHNLLHRQSLTLSASDQRLLGLTAKEVGALAAMEVLYAIADFEGPKPVQLTEEQRDLQRRQASLGDTLVPRQPWPHCATRPELCQPQDRETHCDGFYCNACESAPAGVTSEQCLATLYGDENDGFDTDIQCFLFICWSNGDGGAGSGGSGTGDGGSSDGGNGSGNPVAPAPDCVFDPVRNIWKENASSPGDYVIDDRQRSVRPIAVYDRQAGHLEVANVKPRNLRCGVQGLLGAGILGVFLNQQRLYYGTRAWSSFDSFRPQANSLPASDQTCGRSAFTVPVSADVLAPLELAGNRIYNPVCAGMSPRADIPFQYDWRTYVRLAIDPDNSFVETDEGNNITYTRNWVKLRRRN